ncbi:MAG: hypothetical protein ACKPKO_34690, partial [Candidatus Fonsibacter sp.]
PAQVGHMERRGLGLQGQLLLRYHAHVSQPRLAAAVPPANLRDLACAGNLSGRTVHTGTDTNLRNLASAGNLIGHVCRCAHAGQEGFRLAP